MSIILGTLTTRDGQVIPLPTAADDIVLPDVEVERRKEERRYSRCIHPASSGKAWEGGQLGRAVTRPVALYVIKTENLKRRGITTMSNMKMYETNVFKLFQALFQNPNVWLSSRRLTELTGVDQSSVSTLLKRAIGFLKSEGLLEEKDDPDHSRGHLWMFKGQCENAADEARIWYAKLRAGRGGRGSKRNAPVTGSRVSSVPAQAAPNPNGKRVLVEVDQTTMEAIVRVPLSQLGSVLNLLRQ